MKKEFCAYLALALALTLTACSQARLNEDRMPSGGAQGLSGPAYAENTGVSEQPPEENPGPEDVPDEPSISVDALGPAGADYPELPGSTLEDTRPGWGTVRYTLDSAALYESLEAAGIGGEAYALSCEREYDNYIKVVLTVENVDVPDDDGLVLINDIELMSRSGAALENIAPVWFSLGGEAERDAKRYFAYILPKAGSSDKIELAFGLDGDALSRVRASEGLWMVNNISRTMIKLEGVV